jgi:DUF2075 family protein/nucleoside-triphosphatase THEP1
MTDFEIKRFRFTLDEIEIQASLEPKIKNWPVVYTISDSNRIYIGESTSAVNRLGQHKKNPKKEKLEVAQVILHSKFNISATKDLEARLINYFHGDNKYKVENEAPGLRDAAYYDKSVYSLIFEEVFEKLRSQGLFSKSLKEIENANLFKFSPFKALNDDQAVAIEGILDSVLGEIGRNSEKEIVVQGEPGTGKTIVAIYLMKLLADIAARGGEEDLDKDSYFYEFFTPELKDILSTWKIAIVIPQQALRATIQNAFKSIPGLSAKMVMTPWEVASSKESYDLLIVDEVHRLKMRANMNTPQLNSKFKSNNISLFGKDDKKYTQLDWIRAKSKNRIFLLDAEQSVMPQDLPKQVITNLLDSSKSSNHHFKLLSQMRVKGGEDYVSFISNVLAQSVEPQLRTFDGYELKLFSDFREFQSAITKKESEFKLSRMVAGYAWDWESRNDETGLVKDISIEGVDLVWNRARKDWVSSEGSPDEVGSIHTVQGYDLNYCGVIIGLDLQYDEKTNRIVFSRENYKDTKGKENNVKLGIYPSDEDLLIYVKQIYRVLLTRGIRGTYIYVVDPGLREYFSNFIPKA